MAVLAVAAAGAAVGSAVGGTFLGLSAAAWGWTIGSVVGNYLFAPKSNTEGPRLQGIRYSQSSYGASIPIVFGTMRVGSNVIWMGEVEEIANRQKVGKRAYNTTYTYRQSFAVALCDGPVDGVRRVWFDGQLVFSDEATDVITVVEAAKIAAIMTIYTGSETQLADAVMEAEQGAGDVPAYRGLCYLVFDKLDLTQWGNRIPAITAEVIENGALDAPTLISTDGLLGATGGAMVVGNEIVVATWDPGAITTATLDRYDAEGTLQSSETYPITISDMGLDDNPTYMCPCINDPGLAALSVETLDQFDTYSGFLWLTAGYVAYTGDNSFRAELSAATSPSDNGYAVSTPCVKLGDAVYAIRNDLTGNPSVEKYLIFDGTPATTPSEVWYFAEECVDPLTTGGDGWITTDGTYIYARVTVQDGVDFDKYFRLTADLDFVDYYQAPTTTMPSFAVYDGMHLGFTSNVAGSYVLSQYTIVNQDDAVLIGSETLNPGGDTSFAKIMQVGDGGLVLATNGELSMVPRITPAARTLDDVVEAIATRAGLDSGDIDVTALSAIEVDGYLIDRRTSARAAIEPLLAAYAVDAVESNGKLTFVVRGGAVAVTVYLADTGADSENQSAAGVRRTDTRERDAVLPQRLDVSYASLDAAYEIGTQTATRGQVLSEQQVSVELPLALTEQDAARVAHRLAYELWASRTGVGFATSLQFAALEPTDVIWLERERGGLDRVRIVSKTEDDGILRFEAVHDDDGVIAQVTGGASLPSPGTVRPGASATRMVLFESPPLDDIHADYAGLYAAASPYSGTWPGAELWVNTPGDTDYSEIGALSVQTTVGTVTTAPADWSVERGQVDAGDMVVSVIDGDLDTATESAWLGGSNRIIAGGELIGFKTATSLGAGSYRLTGLLRGLHGTDYAGEHGTGEQFALLDPLAAAHFFVRPTAQIDVSRQYRAVTLGQDVPGAQSYTLAMMARSLMPCSPVHVNVVRQANGDRTFRWTRRARAYQAWIEAADIPLVEDSESYRVQVLDAGTGDVLRSSTVSTASYTYAAADIEEDYPVPPTSIRFKVWQQSEIVGDGEPADVTLAWAGDYNGIYENDWASAATDGMTGFGAGPSLEIENSTHPTKPAFQLEQNGGSSQDAKARFDDVPSFADGLLRVTVRSHSGADKSVGMLARTTYWRNDLNGYGWLCTIDHNHNVIIGYGSNSDAGTFTQVASVAHGVTDGEYFELAWLLAGESHKVFVDGVVKIDTTSAAVNVAGQCGLRVYSGATGADATFDDFSVLFRT